MLELHHVDTFIHHHRIIDHVSFSIEPGSIVGLIGPNGAGKTTIMKTILGLTKFTGQISIDQQPITENDHHALASVGALIEHPAIYPFLTGRQNLVLYAHDPHDLENLVRILQMTNYIDHPSKGYSLGMKQKLGIAIALLNHPRLVILDEPMNGLDVEATICVRRLIQHYADQGTAFLISSHILSELQKVMTQVILINQGRVIVNQPIADFNRLNHQDYHLTVEDPTVTAQPLTSHHIPFKRNDHQFVVDRHTIFTIQDLFAEHHLYLQELAPVETNFEQIIVRILDEQRRSA
ncbi:ABC transporter ATP-binding protein [Levilactobacillus spicheri]